MRTALDVFNEVFAHIFSGPSWDAWRACLIALFALDASPAAAEIVRACTGRTERSVSQALELWVIKGRRAGGSMFVAFLAVYAAAFRIYVLAAGEIGVVMVICPERRQGRVVFGYISAMFASVPMLECLVVARTKDSITLSNGIRIEIQTASFKKIRGYTVVAAILDEIAFYETDESAANPDSKILEALRPAMATVPNALLAAISSPYARKGELWKAYDQHYARNGDPKLVWKADSLTMNPTLERRIVDDAYEADPAAAAAEYGAEFRTDIETFISREILQSARMPGRFELPPMSGVEYVAFTDPSGGTGSDSFTLGIAHLQGDGRAVLDAVREVKPPYSPATVVGEFARELARYRMREVRGDHYAGEWPREAFAAHGIRYITSKLTKSEIYLEALPLMSSGRVELLDHPRLLKQLSGLERRTSRSGKDSIDHEPRQHDDVANAACGALVWTADARRTRPCLATIKVPPRGPAPSNFMLQLRAEKSARLAEQIAQLPSRSTDT